MEGTGLAGGLACLLGRALVGCRYVVSSGDAVGPWVGTRSVLLRPAFAAYERVLCRFADGFIGWTPYLVGRALSFGTRHAMTAAGWADFTYDAETLVETRVSIRRLLGIPPQNLTFGIAGSLVWTKRYRYCYGAELVRAILRIQRPDVNVLIVGAGSGLERLKALAGDHCGCRVFFTGGVPQEDVWRYLAAMDIGSLPQSVDGVGSFRYTTKISEYLQARLPVVMARTPMAYDLEGEWMWRLPGSAPWGEDFIDALSTLMRDVTATDIAERRSAIPSAMPEFDKVRQIEQVTAFLSDLIDQRQ